MEDNNKTEPIVFKIEDLKNDIIEITIQIDKKRLATGMIQRLLSGLQDATATDPKRTRAPNKPKPKAGELPGQQAFPFVANAPKAEEKPAADGAIPPIVDKPVSRAIITKSGETRETARQRVNADLAAAEKKA